MSRCALRMRCRLISGELEWVRWGTLSESIQYGYNAPAQENGRIKMIIFSPAYLFPVFPN